MLLIEMQKFLGLSAMICALFPSMSAGLSLEKFSEGFKRPVDLQAAPGKEDVLFVVEQHGVIHTVDAKTGKKKDIILDIVDRVSRKKNEEGLLGLTFAPDFATSGEFYVNYTDRSPQNAMSHVSRFVMKPGQSQADSTKEERLLSYKQDFRNHNGGWLGFGLDGMLYVATGDGGSANDPKARGQDMKSFLGKLLRIDVSGDSGYRVPADNPFLGQKNVHPEIYAVGLRNPWRCSFDAESGTFWAGDVGQFTYEEINAVNVDELKGKNFGWRMREGKHKNPKHDIAGSNPDQAIDPIYEYTHGSGPNEGTSVTGGIVYRGSIADLKGKYVFGDYTRSRIWTLDTAKEYQFADISDGLQPDGKLTGPIASFGEDHDKNLYVVDHTGVIWKMVE